MIVFRLTAALVVSLGVAAVGAATPSFAQQNGIAPADREIRAEVQRKLRGLDGASRITVDVQAGVVTLSGMVPTLWAKEEAISRARSAGQIQSLVSELEIARAENDAALARQVIERIRKYRPLLCLRQHRRPGQQRRGQLERRRQRAGEIDRYLRARGQGPWGSGHRQQDRSPARVAIRRSVTPRDCHRHLQRPRLRKLLDGRSPDSCHREQRPRDAGGLRAGATGSHQGGECRSSGVRRVGVRKQSASDRRQGR